MLALLAQQYPELGVTPSTATLMCGSTPCPSGDLDAATRLGLLEGRIDPNAAGVTLLWSRIDSVTTTQPAAELKSTPTSRLVGGSVALAQDTSI